MNWLKKNSYATMLLALSILFMTVILLTDEKIETYEQIEVIYGDTLWSLAENYSGKMGIQEWISAVKKVNHLPNEHILSGQMLLVPIEANSNYIAMQTEAYQTTTVASEMK